MNYYKHLKEEHIPVTAAAIYHDLLAITDHEEQAALQFEFYTDNHRFWPRDPSQSPSSARAGENWEKSDGGSQRKWNLKADRTATPSPLYKRRSVRADPGALTGNFSGNSRC